MWEVELAAETETVDKSERTDLAKLWSIGALHTAQYFPGTFTTVALPAVFRQQGLPLESFWILSLPLFPRWLKWLMALAVDNYGSESFGVRKSWIVPCTLTGALLYLWTGTIEPTTATATFIVGILTLKSFIMGAQDIAVDGLATESMSDRERPVGTAIIIFLSFLGSVAGQACVSLIDTYGWRNATFFAALLLIAAATPATLRREPPPPDAAQQRRERGERPDFVATLKRRESRWILSYLFAYGVAGNFIGSLHSAWLIDEGLSLALVGTTVAAATFLGRGAGAILSPILIRRIGIKKAAMCGILIYPVQAIVYPTLAAMPGLPRTPILVGILAMIFFVASLYHYSVNNSRFRWPSRRQAGTDFSLHSSVWNFGVWFAAAIAGFVAGRYGYPIFFVVGAGIAFFTGLLYVLMLDRVEELVVERERAEVA